MVLRKIGNGEFGPIYKGIKGKQAIDFLISQKEGEIENALHHPQIGNIDLIWGKGGERGYGLAKIFEKHPEAIEKLSESILRGTIVDELPGRIIMINKENNQRSIIDLQFNNKLKTWIVTSYIPLK
jgi:phage-Barnase-EndoU-ColicinE5/D-RelE like nuclease1